MKNDIFYYIFVWTEDTLGVVKLFRTVTLIRLDLILKMKDCYSAAILSRG